MTMREGGAMTDSGFFEEDEPADKILRLFEEGSGATGETGQGVRGWTFTFDYVSSHRAVAGTSSTAGVATIR